MTTKKEQAPRPHSSTQKPKQGGSVIVNPKKEAPTDGKSTSQA